MILTLIWSNLDDFQWNPCKLNRILKHFPFRNMKKMDFHMKFPKKGVFSARHTRIRAIRRRRKRTRGRWGPLGDEGGRALFSDARTRGRRRREGGRETQTIKGQTARPIRADKASHYKYKGSRSENIWFLFPITGYWFLNFQTLQSFGSFKSFCILRLNCKMNAETLQFYSFSTIRAWSTDRLNLIENVQLSLRSRPNKHVMFNPFHFLVSLIIRSLI